MKKLLLGLLILIGFSVNAQQTNSSGLTIVAQQSVDGKQYKTVNSKHLPYANTVEFLATVTPTRRHLGEIAYIYNGSVIEVWQFSGGIADINLVKILPSVAGGGGSQNLQQVTNIDSVTTRKITAATFKGTAIPTYNNNAAAISAGLSNGDMYYLPYNNGVYGLAVVINSTPSIPSTALLNENGTPLLNENGTILTII